MVRLSDDVSLMYVAPSTVQSGCESDMSLQSRSGGGVSPCETYGGSGCGTSCAEPDGKVGGFQSASMVTGSGVVTLQVYIVPLSGASGQLTLSRNPGGADAWYTNLATGWVNRCFMKKS